MPERPMIPEATEIAGTETLIGRQGRQLRRFPLELLRRWIGPTATALRHTSGDTTSSGKAKIVFPKKYVEPPQVNGVSEILIIPAAGLVPQQMKIIVVVPSNVTINGCDVTVYQTRGTFLAGASPIELAPGIKGTVLAFGTVA